MYKRMTALVFPTLPAEPHYHQIPSASHQHVEEKVMLIWNPDQSTAPWPPSNPFRSLPRRHAIFPGRTSDLATRHTCLHETHNTWRRRSKCRNSTSLEPCCRLIEPTIFSRILFHYRGLIVLLTFLACSSQTPGAIVDCHRRNISLEPRHQSV